MQSKIKDENTDFLFECILKLETLEECYAFFEDLCTVSEIKDKNSNTYFHILNISLANTDINVYNIKT